MTTDKPYHVDATKDEKLRELFNDRRNTFHNRASAELDLENTGRHARGNIVTGAAPAVHYPPQPTSQWPNQSAVVGVEPPLGIDVNAMDPQGLPRSGST
jgi:hypothetical protein